MRKMLVAAGWGWAAAIIGLSLVPAQAILDVDHGDKAGHLAAYGLLMFWFAQLYIARASRMAHAAVFVAIALRPPSNDHGDVHAQPRRSGWT